MHHSPLLRTKLSVPPTRADLVSRPRLFEQLDAGLPEDGAQSPEPAGFARKLTLVSAPAGFGKTTLVSDWLAHVREDEGPTDHSDCGIAWLSLDEGDNDPVAFLTYLIAALQTVQPGLGTRALSILRSPQPPPAEAVLTALINEIAAVQDSLLLVLDDYHAIEAPAVHDALAFLVEHLPPHMHLAIATRIDPAVPLARLRARGQLTELRAADLKFSSSETAEFLNRVMGLDLSAGDIAMLEARTEGWIAGLQLAALSMQGQDDAGEFIKSLSGSHRFVLDYLIEEVLERQPEDVQAFLLQTAVLDRLTGRLCDAVRFGFAESPGSSFGTTVPKDLVRSASAESPGSSFGTAVLEAPEETGEAKLSGGSLGTAAPKDLVRSASAESPGSSFGTAVPRDHVRFPSAESPSSSSGTAVPKDHVRSGSAELSGSSSRTAVPEEPEETGEAESPGSSSGTADLQDTPIQSAMLEDPGQRQTPSPRPRLDGQATLEMLEHANLFIVPLDEERRWYRYHELFADLLVRQLRHTDPESIPTLHGRASAWYEREGLVDDAIDHALRGGDFERTARLIEEQADAMWQSGQHTRLRRTLVTLPDVALAGRPRLLILRAWYLFARGQPVPARQCLRAAERMLDGGPVIGGEAGPSGQAPQLSDADRTTLRGRAAAIRAFMDSYRGDVPGIIQHAGQALEVLPEHDTAWRCLAGIVLADAHGFTGDMKATFLARQLVLEACEAAGHTYYTMLAHLKLAITAREQGRLARTMEICREQMRLAEQSGLSHGGVVGWSFGIQGEVLAEMGDLDGGMHHVETGVQLAERGGDLAILGWTFLCLMRVLFSRGDLVKAEGLVRKVERAAQKSEFPAWITHQMLAWRARLWLAEGKLDAASEWARKRGLLLAGEPCAPGEPDYFELIECMVVARILMAEERWEQAAQLLQWLLEAAEAGDRTTRVIEILVLQALALDAMGRATEAMASVERALTLSEPEGFVQVFVDEGPPLARLLHGAARRGIAPDCVRQLLAAFPSVEVEPTDESIAQDPMRRLVEPLSERELEVLQLIAEGLANRDIAARLFLSLNTVKAHTRSIYGKLDVHSRTQAVARSHALGLLPRDTL